MVGFGRDLNADQRAFQSDEGALVVDVVATSCNPFLGALFGAICTIKVNLMRAFGTEYEQRVAEFAMRTLGTKKRWSLRGRIR